MNIIMDKWIKPNVDTSKWEYFDLSCNSRDDTDDKVLNDAVAAGMRIKAIFKEPTITPTSEQKQKFGLKKLFGSPNGAMRKGWNGVTISRDTIMIDNLELGYKNIVLCDRHAVGGEYGAKWKLVGPGQVKTTFTGPDGKEVVVDERTLVDQCNTAVFYHNPYDNVSQLADIFYTRCLENNVVP